MPTPDDRSPTTFTDPDEAQPDPVATPPGAGFELREVIGEGGMGTVRVAREHELLRDVAVKTARDPRWERALVLEALVAGALEHPNVPPIHRLERRPDGVRLVMRRIDGAAWSELLRDPARTRALAGERDALSFHVGVLCRVADAVACAHEQGVLHRDVKPANVMVGRLGAVYLLDWGLAVALRDDGRGVPLARAVTTAAGTPGYVSPEQARGDGPALGPASDVYLLGAVLYEIVAGRPPRDGSTRAQLASARVGTVDPLPDDVPRGLRRLITHSLDVEPERRPPTARAFGEALVRWLDTRAAETLADEAARRLASIRRAGDADTERALVEARATFTQALRIDPTHDGARAGLRETLVAAVRHALGRRDVVRARTLLGEIPDPPAELADAQADAEHVERQRELEVARMRAVVADVDVTTGRAERAKYGLAVGGVVGALWVGTSVVDRWIRPVGYGSILATLGAFDLLLGLGLLFWDRWWPNLANRATRQLRYLVATVVAVVTAHWVMSAAQGVPVAAAVAENALVSGAVLLAAGGTYDRALAWGGAFLVGAWLVGVLVPTFALLAVGLATALAFGTYAATAQLPRANP